MQKMKKYSEEYKREAVGLAKSSSHPISQVARDLGVRSNMLARWCREMAADNPKAFQGQGKPRDEGVMGSPRMCDDLRYGGETCGLNRVARLMRQAGLRGIPQRIRWRKKSASPRPAAVENHLSRDFSAMQPNTKWVTDITFVRTAEDWLYLCVVVDLHSGIVVGWSMSHRQDRQLVLQAVLMALWQRQDRSPVILHSDRGCQFTSDEYLRFLRGHNLICSMSAVGSCADNAAAESFFGLLKRERVNRRQYRTRAEARADVFDYIERFHNPRKRRRLAMLQQERLALTQPSVETG